VVAAEDDGNLGEVQAAALVAAQPLRGDCQNLVAALPVAVENAQEPLRPSFPSTRIRSLLATSQVPAGAEPSRPGRDGRGAPPVSERVTVCCVGQ
jgi:hypothetical protein